MELCREFFQPHQEDGCSVCIPQVIPDAIQINSRGWAGTTRSACNSHIVFERFAVKMIQTGIQLVETLYQFLGWEEMRYTTHGGLHLHHEGLQ